VSANVLQSDNYTEFGSMASLWTVAYK